MKQDFLEEIHKGFFFQKKGLGAVVETWGDQRATREGGFLDSLFLLLERLSPQYCVIASPVQGRGYITTCVVALACASDNADRTDNFIYNTDIFDNKHIKDMFVVAFFPQKQFFLLSHTVSAVAKNKDAVTRVYDGHTDPREHRCHFRRHIPQLLLSTSFRIPFPIPHSSRPLPSSLLDLEIRLFQ